MIYNYRKTLTALFLASCLGVCFSGTSHALEVGAKAPDFELAGEGQGTVKLSNTSGSLVYVDFWASWCGPCKESFPWMNKIQEKYKAQGLKVIAVNLDAKTEDAKKFLEQHPARFTVAFDPKGVIPKVYGVKGMPTSFLIGRDGKIIVRHSGFRASDATLLETEINKALEAKK